MSTHKLKIAQPYFGDIKSVRKNFDVREYAPQGYNSIPSDFRIGDKLILQNKDAMDETVERTITYILWDHSISMQGVLAKGWCILGLVETPAEA